MLGTDDEKSAFDLQYKVLRAGYEGSLVVAGKGTTTLYWLSGLIFVSDLIFYFINSQQGYLIAAFLVPAIFLPLAYWSKKKPFEALLSALIIYVTIIVADAVVSPVTLVRGIIVKVIIVGFLFRGVKAAYEARKVRNELNQRHWMQNL